MLQAMEILLQCTTCVFVCMCVRVHAMHLSVCHMCMCNHKIGLTEVSRSINECVDPLSLIHKGSVLTE